jgi:tripartite-type tricarboxylate transporter receptor subunit TctC
MLALTPITLRIRESVAASLLKESVALTKTGPGKIFCGSYGPASGGHFVGELFNMAAGIDVVRVPYKGETPALMVVLAGQVRTAFASIGDVRRYLGRVRAFAFATQDRTPSDPDVPTFAELGYPEMGMPGSGALMAPAKTPALIVQTLTREINVIVMLPDVKARMAEFGFDSVGRDVPRTEAFMAERLNATWQLVQSERVKI